MSGLLPHFTDPTADDVSTTTAHGGEFSSQQFREECGYPESFLTGRRGPRPFVEPAANLQRQKNREAQRTHRERKERYKKDLEYDAARLRQFSIDVTRERDDITQPRDALVRETQGLRTMIASLQAHPRWNASIPELPTPTFSDQFLPWQAAGAGYAPSTVSVSHHSSVGQILPIDGSFASEESSEGTFSNEGNGILDYDAVALNFVLGLERPCMEHIQHLTSRANNSTGHTTPRRPADVPDDGENEEISGHALLASCPAAAPLQPFIDNQADYQLPNIERNDLGRLLGLSGNLPGVGEEELPPIKAWVRLRADPCFTRLKLKDFDIIQRQLMDSVKCHRFGSVVPANELDRAMDTVCNTTSSRSSDGSN